MAKIFIPNEEGVIPEGLIDKIKTSFYKKESINDLLTSSSGNTSAASDMLVDKYTEAYTAWKTNMDDLGYHIFGNNYNNTAATISVNFNNQAHAVELVFLDSDKDLIISNMNPDIKQYIIIEE